MFSNYCSNIPNKYDIKNSNVNKLFPNLGNKSKYVLHYRNLNMCLSLRIKFIFVNKILEFKQFYWLNIYNDFDTNKIKNAVNNLERIYLKGFFIGK